MLFFLSRAALGLKRDRIKIKDILSDTVIVED
jgi:hypothetical protein